MSNLISVLRNMRASILMFLLVLPVIIYLLAISRNYGAAIYAVLGIEDNAKLLLGNFIIFCFSGAVGFWGALQVLRSLSPDILPEDRSKYRQKAFIVPGIVHPKYLENLEEVVTWDEWDPNQDSFSLDWKEYAANTTRLDPFGNEGSEGL